MNENGFDMFQKALVLLFISSSRGTSETIIQLPTSTVCCNTDVTEWSSEYNYRNPILMLVLWPKSDLFEKINTEILQRTDELHAKVFSIQGGNSCQVDSFSHYILPEPVLPNIKIQAKNTVTYQANLFHVNISRHRTTIRLSDS